MIQVSMDPSEDTTANSSVIARMDPENSSNASSLRKDEKHQAVAHSSVVQQNSSSFLPFTGNTVEQDLRPHRSKLPLALYLLSFAPPFHPRSADVTWRDILSHPYVLYAIGVCAALPAGIARPALNLIYGYWTTGIAAKVSAASHKLSERLRHTYLASILVQDAAFFDKIGSGEISTRASKDIEAIRTAFGEKLGYLVWTSSTIITCVVMAFVSSPKFGGVLFSFIPFLAIIFGSLSWANEFVGGPADKLEGQTSSLIEQILSSVRIVQSFGMASSLIKRLDGDLLKTLQRLGAKRSVVRALQQSTSYFACFLVNSVVFWYGGITVHDGAVIGNVLAAFTCYVTLLFALANVVPHITSMADAMGSLKRLRHHLEREPHIDIRDDSGVTPAENGWSPSYELENVTFAYPSRPTVPALKNVSVKIQSGAVVGVCGPSGSGKSTIAALLMREYDPETSNILNRSDEESEDDADRKEMQYSSLDENGMNKAVDTEKATWTVKDDLVKGSGRIYYANRDIREYNLRWLRSQVAVVSQNPQLFTATVFENVAAGLTGTEFEYRPDIDGASDASTEIRLRTTKIRELCRQAMCKAQAWNFVSRLPDGIDTMIAGGRTGVLSGGQKQRLAIARALVRKPACLLLDEATSALDADTEERIRLMLEQELSERGMTTIIIAHRLSTIAKADCIVVMKDGRVVDQGRYEDLMEKDRSDQTFRQLAITQLLKSDDLDDDVYRLDPTEPESNTSHTEVQKVDSSSVAAHSLVQAIAPDTNNTTAAAAPPSVETDERRRSLQRFFRLVKTQKWLFLAGILGGLTAGASFPVAQWMYGQAIDSLRDKDVRPSSNTWSIWLLIFAIVELFVFFINSFFLEVGSESIMRKLKRDSVEFLIKQEIAFFDHQDASAGGLTSTVSSHPANVGAATGNVSAQIITAGTFCLGSVLLAFIIDWRTAVVCLPPTFLMAFAGWLNVSMLSRYEESTSTPATSAASYVNEMTDSVKTIAALGRERETMRIFGVETRSSPKEWRSLILGSLGFGMVHGVILFMASLLFFWSSRRLADGVPLRDVFAVFEAIFTASFSAGRLFTYVGDYSRAVRSFKAIQVWLRRRPQHASCSASAVTGMINPDWASGDILLNHVEMYYPQRPNHPALKDISLRIGAGETHAFCGTSGSGKSSIFALLQRFYDPSSGTITFGGVDHRQLALDDLRAGMAYVSQDPVLFEGTIRWNLSLGSLDPCSVKEDHLRAVCEQAYIWDFVSGLEKGLDTELGMKGVNLSGGQRQRLCIARALVRNPKILLLDEATSALDAESEKAVQMALENASRGRTTITIAHRLSTIRSSDVIHVIEDGWVKESGSHEELLRKRGRYLELVQTQM